MATSQDLIREYEQCVSETLKITKCSSVSELEQGIYGRWEKLSAQEKQALLSGKDKNAARKVAFKIAGNFDWRSKLIAEFDQSEKATKEALNKFKIGAI